MSQSGPLDDISEMSGASGQAGSRIISAKGPPLPPIGSKSASRSHSGASFTTFSSMHRDSPDGAIKAEEGEDKAAKAPKEPLETKLRLPLNSTAAISASESRQLLGFDGTEHLMVSLACQTEWSWMEDMRHRSLIGGSVTEAAAPSNASASPVIRPRSGYSGWDETALSGKGKSPSRGRTSQSLRSGRSTSTKSGKAGSILPPYPEPRVDDEYGIPLADSSDESEFISDVEEEEPARTQAGSSGPTAPTATATSAAIDGTTPAETKATPTVGEATELTKAEKVLQAAEEGIITGVGPPQILQYLRESELPASEPDDPDARIASLKIEPGSACQFCGRPISTMPSLEEQATKSPEELFCCSEYRELLDYALKHPLNIKSEDGKLIDIKPHPPHGNQKVRKEAKERAEKRIRERAMARQQASMLAAQSNYMQGSAPSTAASRPLSSVMSGASEFARQMKTINYQLSSMKCLDEGWTLRAPSPLGLPEETEMFELDASAAERGNLFGLTSRPGEHETGGVFVKFYPNGRKFLTLFEDATGNVFYPSGNLAILLTRTDLTSGLVTFVIFEDVPAGEANLLAIFDTAGHGTCYFQNGNIRLTYDQLQGIDLDIQGNRRRSWMWGGQLHVHAPPFQPLCFALNRTVGVRMTSREQVHVNFTTTSRNCRINVGAKLKLVNPGPLPFDPTDEDRLRLEETRNRIAMWLEKADTVMRYPHHPRLEKVPTSLHLKSQKERLEQQKAKLQERYEAAVK